MRNKSKCSGRAVSPEIREALGKYRGIGTMNSALEEVERLAELALAQGVKVEPPAPIRNATLHVDLELLNRVKLTAKRYSGQDLSIEDSIMLVLALAAKVKT